MDFRKKFVGFVDVLGFSDLVEKSAAGSGPSSVEVEEIMKCLGDEADRKFIIDYGPKTCPDAARLENALDFELTQVTDCVVVSAECSPAGLINVVAHCWLAALRLLQRGLMCRGFITKGPIVHSGNMVYGPAYQRAVRAEKTVAAFKRDVDKRGTPFIEVDEEVRRDVVEGGDRCVREMFGRYTRTEGGSTAIFPFQVLAHSFSIGPLYGMKFEPEKEKASNDNVRKMLGGMRDRVLKYVDHNNPDAVRKAEHYVAALDAQLAVCDRTDEMLRRLTQPFSKPIFYGFKP